MKFILVLISSFYLNLYAINFDLPPAQEEVFDTSILGEEVKAEKKSEDKKVKKSIDLSFEKEFQNGETSQSSTLYVTHKRRDSYVADYPTYPKIALLVPTKVIKHYANSISNTILSYLIFKGTKFKLELFDSVDEKPKHIVEQLDKIRSKGYRLVIAVVTINGAKTIVKSEGDLTVYIPTVNKKELGLQSPNIFFGGIDYEEQIDKLLTFAGEKVAIFGDGSKLSRKIGQFVQNAAFSDIIYNKHIKNPKASMKYLFKDNKKLEDASIFINMPIVKTSLFASQLDLYKLGYKNILLTQIAYNPLIFTLTQPKTRQNMLIVNSISKNSFVLKDINLILGANLDFAWVNYSTFIGCDNFFTNIIYSGERKSFVEEIVNNQVIYNIELLKPTNSSFKKINLKYQ